MKMKPTGAWMTFGAAVAWIAFRDARPFEQWNFTAAKLNRPWPDWGFPMLGRIPAFTDWERHVRTLSAALQYRAAGQAWRPPTDDPLTGDSHGTWWSFCVYARELVRRFNASAAVLASELEQDIATQMASDKRLEEARQELIQAIKDEKLTVRGRPAHAYGRSDPSAISKKLDPALLQDPPRTIISEGWLTPDYWNLELKHWDGYKEPFFDRVHVRTGELLTLWTVDGEAAEVGPPPPNPRVAAAGEAIAKPAAADAGVSEVSPLVPQDGFANSPQALAASATPQGQDTAKGAPKKKKKTAALLNSTVKALIRLAEEGANIESPPRPIDLLNQVKQKLGTELSPSTLLRAKKVALQRIAEQNPVSDSTK
jgi:hypothetical protein